MKCSPNCKTDTCRHTDGWCTRAADLADYNCTTGNSNLRIFTVAKILIGKNEDGTLRIIEIKHTKQSSICLKINIKFGWFCSYFHCYCIRKHS